VAGGPIAVVPYDPEWPRRFEAEGALLERVLAPWLEGGIQHIGSTAVPGLASKPIVDMMAGVQNLNEARAAYEPLEAEGYAYTPHRPGIAHHFDKRRSPEGRFGLHLPEPGSDLWRERLAIRDALRSDAALAGKYEALKLRLAREHAGDGEAYTLGKRAFVARELATHGIQLGAR
jgi:GrpB-like predicted nucleotidyltransferase (UPF0157 family)